jgi:hypothetical protein
VVTAQELAANSHISLDIPGIELQLSVERIADVDLRRDVSGAIDLASLALKRGREHPLFVTARQRDQSRVWSSPLFLTV